MLCTPGYTSPEQALGRPVDRRSDVYSMAITLYRVLAGRLPFHEVRGKHIAAVLARHIFNEPTLLAEAAGAGKIPPAVAAVVESALRKDPAQRPQTMLEFADALRAAASIVPVVPKRRAPRVHRTLLAFGLGLAATWLLTPRSDCPPGPRLNDVTALPLVASVPASPPPVDLDPPAADITLPLLDAEPEHPAAATVDNSPAPGLPRRPSLSARDAARRRLLTSRAADIQQCVDRAGSAVERLRVRVSVDATGHLATSVVDAEATPLNRCVDSALKQLTLAPGPADSFLHTFTVKAAPSP